MNPKKISAARFFKPSPYTLYLPEKLPAPLICMTPILGRLAFFEDLFFERRFAQFFAASGFACALIERPIFDYNPSKPVDQIQRYLDDSIVRNKSVLDELINNPGVDPKRIASFGISFGAIANILWAAADPRLSANVFALAGANIPEIFVRSRDPLMRSYYHAAVRSTGLEAAALRDKIADALCLDPSKACRKLNSEHAMLILARFDRVVPFKYGLELRKAMGEPRTIYLPTGHYGALLLAPLLRYKVRDFFREEFFKFQSIDET